MSVSVKAKEAAERLRQNKYLPWTNAGGPNECAHGRAEGIPCPHCDEFLVFLGQEDLVDDGSLDEE